jgi:hypothetical protein
MTESRQEDDFYATDPRAVIPLMEHLGWLNGDRVIWDNSCGMGHLCTPLEKMGHIVIATDLVDRGHGVHGVDFLNESVFDHMPVDAIVMNPPFKHALEFIRKSIKIAPVVCAFLRLGFLEGGDKSGRYEFFTKESPPTQILIFSDRVPSAKDGDFDKHKNGKTPYIWVIWEKDKQPQPPKWIRI